MYAWQPALLVDPGCSKSVPTCPMSRICLSMRVPNEKLWLIHAHSHAVMALRGEVHGARGVDGGEGHTESGVKDLASVVSLFVSSSNEGRIAASCAQLFVITRLIAKLVKVSGTFGRVPSLATAKAASTGMSSSNGTRYVIISHARIPNEYTSHRSLYGSCRMTSGAIHR